MSDLRHGIWIDAAPEEVFEAVSTPEGLQRWWTSNAHAQGPEDLARYTVRFDDGQVEATFETEEHRPPDRLELACVDGIEDWIDTRLVFELEPADGGTFLSFDHAGWTEQDWYFRACNSTWGHLLFLLKRTCEEGVERPLFAG